MTSRLQRDLTDSSMQRNIGTAFGHSLLAIDNVRRGLAGLDADPAALARDLDATWEVLGEAVQSVMRVARAWTEPYERLKELTRGRRVDAAAMREFVGGLGLPAGRRAAAARAHPGHVHRPRRRTRGLTSTPPNLKIAVIRVIRLPAP